MTSEAQGGQIRTLLVVDDQHPVRVSLEYILHTAGYRPICVESGDAAIAALKTQQIDGAIVDVHMPVKNGIDTCAGLHDVAKEMGRSLKVWLMTGASTELIERRSVEVGALGVLKKPFAIQDLLSRLTAGFSVPLADGDSAGKTHD